MKVFVKQMNDGFYVYHNNENGDLLAVFSRVEDAAAFVKSLRYL